MSFDAFERALGYRFQDPALLKLALTHRSAGQPNNERLEFLGDAVLGYVVAELLSNERPNDHEDMLTLLRAALVRREALAEIATSLKLGDALVLGPSAASSGGHRRASILADALEAVIGAVHSDGGLDAARELIHRHWRDIVDRLDTSAVKDPKTRLQELLQAARKPLPEYRIHATAGEEHRKTYEVECLVDGAAPTLGVGSSRRSAEKEAAAAMLEQLS